MYFLYFIASIFLFGSTCVAEPPKLDKSLDTPALKKKFSKYVSPAATKDTTIYHQKHDPIEDATDYLQKNGQTLVEIELTNVNDALIQVMVDNCPNLKSFSIHPNFDDYLEDLTTVGITALQNLPALDQLDLNIWYASITPESLQNVLRVQQNLSNLALSSYRLNDACLEVIASYSNLTSLKLTSNDLITNEGLIKCLQSTLLAATLTAFEFHSWLYINDDFVQALAKYTQLTSLVLSAQWHEVTEQAASNLLEALTNLKTLNLNRIKISRGLAKSFAGLKLLADLRLFDCSQLWADDFDTMLQPLNNLQVLHLGNCTYFSDSNAKALLEMPLRNLSLTNCSWFYDDGLKQLCSAKSIQKNLSHLEISGAYISSSAFKPISMLRLKTLRIEKCPHFNDTVMLALIDGALVYSLEALELDKVYISDTSAADLAKFKKLNTLMICDCYAITIKGSKELLTAKSLLKQVKKLYIDGVPLTKEMIQLLGEFKNLDVLMVGNPGDLNIFKWADEFWHLPNVVDNNAFCFLYAGEKFRWKDFKKA